MAEGTITVDLLGLPEVREHIEKLEAENATLRDQLHRVEAGDPPEGSRLWRCEQELKKAREQLRTIINFVTEAPFPKGMYLIDKGHIDAVRDVRIDIVDSPSIARAEERVAQFNGGQRCDTAAGPCACGAWHEGPVGPGQTFKLLDDAERMTSLDATELPGEGEKP